MFGNAKNRGSNSIAPLRQDSTISLEVLDSQTIANGGNYSASHRNGKKPVLPEDVSETLRQIMADVTSAGQQANNELDMSLNYLKYLFWKIKKWFFSSRKINKMLNKALVESCSMEFKSFVNPLLKAGADPNGEPGQWGPLHATAFWGGSEIMRYE
ncbi:hypothetical protein C0J52_13481 [Blattella germanica]|nr:hypothetical protein C0J52_13481 [Blattella germanica]